MTQGDERWNDLTDEEFFAALEEQHGKAIADRARNVQRERRRQVPRKVGVKAKVRVPRKPTRRADDLDRLRHGEPPPRLLAPRAVKRKRAS